MRLTLTLLLLMAVGVFSARAQVDQLAFGTSGSGLSTAILNDYQCVGINPANLGWIKDEGKSVHLGLIDFGVSIFSNALTKNDIKSSYLTFSGSEFSFEEKVKAAEIFNQKSLALDLGINELGVAFQNEKIGGFAFSIRERISTYFYFDNIFSELLFEGFKAPYFDSVYWDPKLLDSIGVAFNPTKYSTLFGGSRISMNWFREYNLSYGRNVIDMDLIKIYAGIGLKYLTGYGTFDLMVKDGELTGYTSLSPVFGIKWGDNYTPSHLPEDGKFKKVGTGLGFDIAISALLMKQIRVAVSVCDIGSITWNGNVYEVYDTMLKELQTAGFNNYNVFLEAEKMFEHKGVFKWRGLESKKISLPTMVRFGAAWEPTNKINVGADFAIPAKDVAGGYQNVAWAFGANYSPFKWVQLSAGVTGGGNYGVNIPLGLKFKVASTWEIGVSTRDIVTYISNVKPAVSASFGFLRFCF